MTIQIGARLPDDDVHYIDEKIAAGVAPSRSAYLARLVSRERRRERAITEMDKLAIPDPELDAFVGVAASQYNLSGLD